MKLVTVFALAYVLLGAAGLTLVIPPGYASPVFPAAGLALAGVLWFGWRALVGVWLGSALLNLAHPWLSGSLNQTAMLVALVIATGATVQAAGGWWLVTRWQGAAWRRLEREQDALGLLLLGGVLAGVLSASIGVTGLAAGGLITRTQVAFTWWNWYVGDTLGVLVFAPLTLALLERTDPLWRERRRRLLLPMLLTLGLAMLAFYGAARWEQQTQANQVRADGEGIAQRISDRLITHREVLASLQHFIEATPDFSFAQFEQFTRLTLNDHPDIFALSFNDLVTDAERPAFERRISDRSPLGPYRITERDAQRRLVRAATRPDYVAVRYIVPIADNQPAVGYDINSEPIRRAAIERALATHTMAVTAPIRLVQEQRPGVGVLELLPVTIPPASGASEAPRPSGFAVAVIRIDALVNIATRGQVPAGLVFQVTDPQAPAGQELLFRSDAREADASPAVAQWGTGLRMGDRYWVLSVATTERYRQEHRPWLAWAVGVAGLMFTTLLQALMLGMTGRTDVIRRYRDHLEELAEARTRQLADTNHTLVERSRQAESATRAKSAFLANMSQEIRTPLNAVLGLAQVLDREPLTANQRDMVERIQAAGQSLLVIINDVLDLSKIEAGQLRLEHRPFALEPLLAKLDSLLGESAHAKGIGLRVAAPALPLGPMVGDGLRLEQVLTNLIGNAIKFTEHGEVELRVQPLASDATTVRLRFEVCDTGIGIAPEAQEGLFTPFTQAEAGIARRFGGTGLGLSICKRLVEKMGGVIGAESRPGQGSVFWFELPIAYADTDAVATDMLPDAAPGEPVPTPSGPRLAGLKVLVVDDSAMNLDVVERALATEGAVATLAADGQQAVQVLRNRPAAFDAVLMDVRMPVMDGLTATRLIRAELGLNDLPIIAFTAGVLSEEQAAARDAGVNAVLAKPLDLEQMVALLLQWLGPRPVVASSHPLPVVSNDAGELPDIPGIDRAHAAQTLGRDPAFFLRLLTRFADDFADAVAQARRDLAQGEREAATRRLHTLRGNAGNLGAIDLMESARGVEEALVQGAQPLDLEEGLATLDRRLAALLEASAPWRSGSAAAAATTAPGIASEPPPDPSKFNDLREALRCNDAKARRLFKELAPSLRGLLGETTTQALAVAIRELRFDVALDLLDRGIGSGSDQGLSRSAP